MSGAITLPVIVNVNVSFGFGASLLIATVAEYVPAVVDDNTISNVALLVAAIVLDDIVGLDGEKFVPVTLTLEIVRVAVPGFATVNVSILGMLIGVDPTLKGVGVPSSSVMLLELHDTVMSGCAVAVTVPVIVNVYTSFGDALLLFIVTTAVYDPAVADDNTTSNVAVPDDVIVVADNVGADGEKSVPLTLTLDMIRSAFPEFDIVNVVVFGVLIMVDPTLKGDGVPSSSEIETPPLDTDIQGAGVDTDVI